jgi:hypothetical protein
MFSQLVTLYLTPVFYTYMAALQEMLGKSRLVFQFTGKVQRPTSLLPNGRGSVGAVPNRDHQGAGLCTQSFYFA